MGCGYIGGSGVVSSEDDVLEMYVECVKCVCVWLGMEWGGRCVG